ADGQKDQSYVLAGLTQEQLAYLRFPVGVYTKAQIRDIARRHGLSVADKPDSQEICFVPDGDYAAVVARFEPEALRPGPIYDLDGRRLGEHRGLARYTVGQRRRLGLAGGSPRYVGGIDPGRRRPGRRSPFTRARWCSAGVSSTKCGWEDWEPRTLPPRPREWASCRTPVKGTIPLMGGD